MKNRYSRSISGAASLPFFISIILAFGLGMPASAQDDAAPVRLSGSVLTEAGYLAFRDALPDAAVRDWYGRTSANVRLEADSDEGRFLSNFWTRYDAAAGTWELSMDECWMEWRPAPFVSLRLGRFPLRYGPGVAFNPANSLAKKDGFDARADKRGHDGAELEFRPFLAAGIRDLPVSLIADAALLLPAAAAVYDLDEASAHGRLTLYAPGFGLLGPTELGVSGDLRRLGGAAPGGKIPAAGGAWISLDLAEFVIGAEGGVRTADYRTLSEPGTAGITPGATGAASDALEFSGAFSLNRRLGDFFILAETCYSDIDPAWLLFARLAWTGDDIDISLSTLADFEAAAARTGLDLSWTAGDFLVLRAGTAWNYRPDQWTPAQPTDYAVSVAAEFFF